MTLTIGADPEVFFANKKSLVSTIGLIGGTKEKPKDLGGGFMILSDNVAGEFNIPPAKSATEFANNIVTGLDKLVQVAIKNNCHVSRLASASFPEDQLKTPQALEFGCEPDVNAWTLEFNMRPNAVDSTLRSCGGHVHVGGITEDEHINVIRAMDLFLGVPSIILDNDTERRKLYGKAGAFRPKPYGVEYRSLSNWWIFEPTLCDWVWDATVAAVKWAQSNPLISEHDDTGKLVRSSIDNSDKDTALQLLEKFPEVKELMPSVAA